MNTLKVVLFLVTQGGGLQPVPHDFATVEECKASIEASFYYRAYKDPYTTNSKRTAPKEYPVDSAMCVVIKGNNADGRLPD